MALYSSAKHVCRQQRGAVLIVLAVLLMLFVGITALAIDLGHLYLVRNELQNAADAGALAGASNLIDYSSGAIREDANQIAYDTALLNASVKLPVEVHWTSGNVGDVQRGHWSFTTRTFTPNASLNQVDLVGISETDLDVTTDFINAVRVVARRSDNPVPAFFAGFFGFESFARSAEAVAYIGFAGQLEPGSVDQPIAICQDSILQNDAYNCNIGRMINSGQNVATSETGAWTDFNQEGNPCQGGTNSNTINSLICHDGNRSTIHLGQNMAITNGGLGNSTFGDLIRCWEAATGRTEPWELTLPVISCAQGTSTCAAVVGAVKVEVVWINGVGTPKYSDAPTQMGDWSSSDPIGQNRWASFVEHFDLINVDGSSAPYAQQSLYFKPSCEYHEPPLAHTGGRNFGFLARFPVLVR